MLNQKQFGCLKFLSVNFNDTQVCKGETSKKTTIHKLTSRYGKYGPRSGYGFLPTACQPIRIENFEKPYNKNSYFAVLILRSGRSSTPKNGGKPSVRKAT